MADPVLSGALSGLSVLSPRDRERFREAVDAGGQNGWGYFFPHLLSLNRPGRSAVLTGDDEGAICLYRWRFQEGIDRADVYLPPLPFSREALRRAIARSNDFTADRSARVMRIDAKDADAVASVAGLRVRRRRLQYIFAPGQYESLAGKDLYTVRRNVALVERRTDVEVAAFTPAHAEGCRTLLERWEQAHREAHGTAGGAGGSRRAIALAETAPGGDLEGEVVLVAGRVAAYAFGGEIRRGLACSFDRKSDPAVRGLSYFHFRSFLRSLRRFDRINDGSDTGRGGLRQLKDSFRPVEMHEESRASQRRGHHR